MIDQARVDELRSEIGDEDFAEVLELFVSEMEEGIEAFDDSAPPDRRSSDLHALKGSAANVGFSGLADICREEEERIAAGQNSADMKSKLLACFTVSREQIIPALA